MRGKLSASKVLSEAVRITQVWQANPDFQLGNVTLEEYQEAMSGLQSLDSSVEAKRVELIGLMDQRDDKIHRVNDLNTRAFSGFRAFYGPDSSQYAQVGGTRRSERKSPTRKPKQS